MTDEAPRIQARKFVPTSAFIGGTSIRTAVKHWQWTKGFGVRVTYEDGLECRSENSIYDLLNGGFATQVEATGLVIVKRGQP